MITHRGIDYITLDEFTKDIELKNTFIGLIKRDKRIIEHDNYYELKKLKSRLKSFNKKYHPPGYILLRDFHEKSSRFTGYISGSKVENIVLPLYKTNGKRVNSKKWIIYKEFELKKTF